MQFNDVKRLFVCIGDCTQFNDEELEWLEAQGVAIKTMADSWVAYLKAQPETGNTGARPDLFREYLSDLGYTGSINDMKVQFYSGIVPVGFLTQEDGFFLLQENNSKIIL